MASRQERHAIISALNKRDDNDNLFVAPEIKATVESFMQIVSEYVVNGAGMKKASSILEAGGGANGGEIIWGWLANFPNAFVHVVDIEPTVVAISQEVMQDIADVLQKSFSHYTPQIKIEQADVQTLPGESYDIVSLRNPRAILSTDAGSEGLAHGAYTALKPGGTLFVTSEFPHEIEQIKGYLADTDVVWTHQATNTQHLLVGAAFWDHEILIGTKPSPEKGRGRRKASLPV